MKIPIDPNRVLNSHILVDFDPQPKKIADVCPTRYPFFHFTIIYHLKVTPRIKMQLCILHIYTGCSRREQRQVYFENEDVYGKMFQTKVVRFDLLHNWKIFSIIQPVPFKRGRPKLCFFLIQHPFFIYFFNSSLKCE